MVPNIEILIYLFLVVRPPYSPGRKGLGHSIRMGKLARASMGVDISFRFVENWRSFEGKGHLSLYLVSGKFC